MNLNDTDKDIYNRLEPKEQFELRGIWDSTALWEKAPKMVAGALGVMILLAFIF